MQQQLVVCHVLEAAKKVNALIEEGWRVEPHSLRVTAGVVVPNAANTKPAEEGKRRTVHILTALLEKD